MNATKFVMSIVVMLIFAGISQTNGQWLYNGTHIYNSNSGNVGIGNNTPGSLLYVAKSMAEPTITVRNLGGTGGATYTMIDDASGANWKFKATNNGGFKIRDQAYLMDVITIEPNSAANVLNINSNGYVGLGTVTPTKELDVEGDIRMSDAWTFLYINNTLAGANAGLQFQYNGNAKAWFYYDEGDNLLRFNADPIGSRNDLVITSTGDIGIGTATPEAKMELYYNSRAFSMLGYTNAKSNYFYHNEVIADGDGQSALYAARTNDFENDGTDYDENESNAGLCGVSWWGTLYSFGSSGFNYNDYTRCGGILGAQWDGNYWGSLGYKSSGSSLYGGYFSSYASGSGKSGQPAMIGIGVGAWGDLMGADIHGKVYGIYAEGENYAMYSHGNTYKDALDIHLQDNGTATNTVLYTNTSTDVTVQTSGKATLSGGIVNITFDPAFTASLASEESLVITVTPIGESNGVHLSDISENGFKVVENNSGKSSVTVNFIAIGKRAGYENPALAKEVINADYTDKLSRGLHADADTQTKGEGLYYENGQLVVGIHPSTLPDPNKPREEAIKPTVAKASDNSHSEDPILP